MSCSNCFNGCDIISDRCIKYTGIDIPELGIQTGDSLSHVEQSLTTYLVSVLNGTGVKIDLTGTTVCNLVQKYLPTCGDLTIVDISKALIKAACDLQVQIDAIVVELTALNGDYTIGCLTGVIASSNTHDILQAVITKLCALNTSFNALVDSLPRTYVSINNLNDLIQAYLDSTTGDLISNKMVPYAVLPYFGPLTNFDSTGAGTGTWNKVYLCNGNHLTPDLRGRALTGAIASVPGPTITDPVIIPGGGNPNYALGYPYGANQISLLETQIPSHTHANTVNTILTDPGHTHSFNKTNDYTSGGGSATSGNGVDGTQLTSNSGVGGTGIRAVTTITNAAAPIGGGLPHANIQPVIACYYIQYRP